MYQIIIDNRDGGRYILHDSRSSTIRVTGAKCEMELNKTGTLSFKINPTHPNFGAIKKHHSEIYLFQDDECIFCGRVLNDEVDIYNFKTVICEGMLGYLLDSIQRAKSYEIKSDTKIKDYITDILNIHNSQVDDHKKFGVGLITEVDDSDTFYKISSYKDTLTTLNSDLVDTFHHTYLIAGFKDGKKVINYVNSSQLPTNKQVIKLGNNLLKLTRSVKGEEIATAIIPLGATTESVETEHGETLETKLTIKDEPDGLVEGTESIYKKDDYIYDERAVEKYGWIFKTIAWNGIEEDTKKLLKNAVEQLNYYNKLAKRIELNAFDLHLIDISIDSFRVGQKVRVYSKKIHDLDAYMIVQRMSIDIDNPAKTTIVLGDEERISIDVNSSLTKKTSDLTDKDYLDKDYFNSDEYKNRFNNDSYKYLGTNDYKNNFNDLFKDNFKNYSGTDDFKSRMNDFFDSQNGTGSITDLSKYALVTDVQSAFNELSDLLSGV